MFMLRDGTLQSSILDSAAVSNLDKSLAHTMRAVRRDPGPRESHTGSVEALLDL